jgi:hypothetical protein
MIILETIEEATTKLPAWVDPVLVIAGWPATTLLAYWAGVRQSRKDRSADLYKHAVLDPSIEDINAFFDQYRMKLSNVSSVGGKAVPKVIGTLHIEFSEHLRALGNGITGRIHTFDSDAVESIEIILDDLDDQITAWCFSTKPRDREGLLRSLNNGKRNLIKTMFKAKFDLK